MTERISSRLRLFLAAGKAQVTLSDDGPISLWQLMWNTGQPYDAISVSRKV